MAILICRLNLENWLVVGFARIFIGTGLLAEIYEP